MKTTMATNARDFISTPLVMIPGPTEQDPRVYAAMSQTAVGFKGAPFVAKFSRMLKNLRHVLLAKEDSQPVVIAGGGAIGWDALSASLLEPGDKALTVSSGLFAHRFDKCLKAYGAEHDEIFPDEPGEPVESAKLIAALEKTKYKIVAMCAVDTSVGVYTDIKVCSEIIRKYNPEAYILVDGVCSFAGEEFRFGDWDIDGCMTGAQKALGVPPGLSIMCLSARASKYIMERKVAVANYYANLQNWIPIMISYEKQKPGYFSTPNTMLIEALDAACQILLGIGMENVFERHRIVSRQYKAAITAMGLKSLAIAGKEGGRPATTMTCVYYPDGVTQEQLLPAVLAEGVVHAGGLGHTLWKNCPKYMRIGHMGYSAYDADCPFALEAVKRLERALNKLGHTIEEGTAATAFTAAGSVDAEEPAKKQQMET